MEGEELLGRLLDGFTSSTPSTGYSLTVADVAQVMLGPDWAMLPQSSREALQRMFGDLFDLQSDGGAR